MRRIAAILNLRNILMRVAVSPRIVRLRIRAEGKPLLGLADLPERTLEHACKIVVVRLDRIGDAVLFSSFLRELRTSAPKAEIHLVCSPVGLSVYNHCPYVNHIHVFEHGEPVCIGLALHTAREHGRLFRAAKAFAREHLAPLHADLLLAPRFEVDCYGGTHLAAFSGAKFSVSYSEKATDIRRLVNRGHDKLWSVIIPSSGVEHEVLRNAAFLNQIGVSTSQPTLEFWPTTEERNTANTFLALHKCRERPVVLAPSASEPRKQWPSEWFASVIRSLEEAGKDVVLVGSASDAPLCSSITRKLQSTRVHDASGQLTPANLFCLLQRSCGFVGNDSGPAHLAAAAGVPVVIVSCHPRSGRDDYHQSPRRFGPWGVPHHVLQPEEAIPPCADHCSADRSHCIEQVSVDQVVGAALNLLIDQGVSRASASLCASSRQ